MSSMSLKLDFQVCPYYYNETLTGPRPRRPDYFLIRLNDELSSPGIVNSELSERQEVLDNYLYARGIGPHDENAINADPVAYELQTQFTDLAQAFMASEINKPETARVIEDYVCRKYNLEGFAISNIRPDLMGDSDMNSTGGQNINAVEDPLLFQSQPMASTQPTATTNYAPQSATTNVQQPQASAASSPPSPPETKQKKHRFSNLFRSKKKTISPNYPQDQLTISTPVPASNNSSPTPYFGAPQQRQYLSPPGSVTTSTTSDTKRTSPTARQGNLYDKDVLIPGTHPRSPNSTIIIGSSDLPQQRPPKPTTTVPKTQLEVAQGKLVVKPTVHYDPPSIKPKGFGRNTTMILGP
ncbi:hypothetical protein TRVA0_007S01794 [Trichomonascus vanleenenianus]|uniref:uncharacterized protein n=1 Tax=Trichomonascus vanleenenianus TaxID=2268995 RepID=UPI003EC96AD8